MTMNAVSVNARDLLAVADPPPEIAAEPARLAVWMATKRSDVAVLVLREELAVSAPPH